MASSSRSAASRGSSGSSYCIRQPSITVFRHASPKAAQNGDRAKRGGRMATCRPDSSGPETSSSKFRSAAPSPPDLTHRRGENSEGSAPGGTSPPAMIALRGGPGQEGVAV